MDSRQRHRRFIYRFHASILHVTISHIYFDVIRSILALVLFRFKVRELMFNFRFSAVACASSFLGHRPQHRHYVTIAELYTLLPVSSSITLPGFGRLCRNSIIIHLLGIIRMVDADILIRHEKEARRVK